MTSASFRPSFALFFGVLDPFLVFFFVGSISVLASSSLSELELYICRLPFGRLLVLSFLSPYVLLVGVGSSGFEIFPPVLCSSIGLVVSASLSFFPVSLVLRLVDSELESNASSGLNIMGDNSLLPWTFVAFSFVLEIDFSLCVLLSGRVVLCLSTGGPTEISNLVPVARFIFMLFNNLASIFTSLSLSSLMSRVSPGYFPSCTSG